MEFETFVDIIVQFNVFTLSLIYKLSINN